MCHTMTLRLSMSSIINCPIGEMGRAHISLCIGRLQKSRTLLWNKRVLLRTFATSYTQVACNNRVPWPYENPC